jgi:quinol monooxygenase YgiN
VFAQVIEAAMSSADRVEMVRIVREELVPALRDEEGFSGAVGMVEAGTGRAMMIAFWEHEAQAAILPARRGHAFRAALSKLEARSEQPRSISTWEVGIEL